MKKLISMVETVPEHPHAKFLQQIPTLGMFVPCDEDGNVLEEPDSVGVGNEFYYERALDQYQQAEQRVIFDVLDIKFHNCKEFKYQSELILIMLNEDAFLEYNCYYKDFTIYIYNERSHYIATIEDLVPYNLIMK